MWQKYWNFLWEGWLLVVLGFNATLTAKVISWRSMTHMCFLAFSCQYLHSFSFQSHRLLFSHASAEVRGENTQERNVTSTRIELRITRSRVRHAQHWATRAGPFGKDRKHCWKRRKCWLPAFSPFPTKFSEGYFFRVVKSRDCVVKS